MAKRATENIIDHLDGFAVVSAQEKNGLIAVNCPFCDDAHGGLKTTERDLQTLDTPCRDHGYYVWTGEPDEFNPAKEKIWQIDVADDGEIVLLGFEEDERLKVRCRFCREIHEHGPIENYESGDRVRRPAHCPDGLTYVIEVPTGVSSNDCATGE